MCTMMTRCSYDKTTSGKNDRTIQRSAAVRKPVVRQQHPLEIIQRVRMNPASLNYDDVIQLQGTIGNKALHKLLSEVHGNNKSQAAGKPMQMKGRDGGKEADLIGRNAASESKISSVVAGQTNIPVIQLKMDTGEDKTLDSILDTLQTLLDIVGFIPGLGDAADALNVVISLVRGDIVNAAFSAIAIVPLVGSAISAPLKAIHRASGNIKLIKKAVDILSNLFGDTGKIISVLDDVYGSVVKFAAKIPDELSSITDNWLVKKALGKNGIKALEGVVSNLRKEVDNLIAETDNIISSAKTAIKGASDDVAEGVGNTVKYGPLNKGPLPDAVAKTFRSSSYTKLVTQEEITLYRAYGGKAGEIGSFWTRTKPQGPLQTVIDSALDQNWGNTATNISTIKVPKGTTIYEGFAAQQRGLVGGGSQVYIERVDPSWLVK